MHLVKGFPNSYASFFSSICTKGRPLTKMVTITAVGTGPRLRHLIDDLHLVAGFDILLIPEIDILNMPVIKDKVVDIVIVRDFRVRSIRLSLGLFRYSSKNRTPPASVKTT